MDGLLHDQNSIRSFKLPDFRFIPVSVFRFLISPGGVTFIKPVTFNPRLRSENVIVIVYYIVSYKYILMALVELKSHKRTEIHNKVTSRFC